MALQQHIHGVTKVERCVSKGAVEIKQNNCGGTHDVKPIGR